MFGLEAVRDVCDVLLVSGPEADPGAPPDLFIDLPHGATRWEHLSQWKRGLSGYPGDDYDLFFLANTDQGSPEYALHLAHLLTTPAAWRGSDLEPLAQTHCARFKVLLLRSLLPRTLVDVNRVWATQAEAIAAGLTPGVPEFINQSEELERMHGAYRQYHQQAERGYALTSGGQGFALNLHTYAPISVSPIEGEYIVDTLRRAYTDAYYPTYPVRPVVQLITTPPDGPLLSNPHLRDLLIETYAARGIQAICDNPFNLHPATCGYTYAARYPQRTLTMELSRAALAEVFDPFTVMTICPDKVETMTRPIAQAFLRFLGH